MKKRVNAEGKEGKAGFIDFLQGRGDHYRGELTDRRLRTKQRRDLYYGRGEKRGSHCIAAEKKAQGGAGKEIGQQIEVGEWRSLKEKSFFSGKKRRMGFFLKGKPGV